MIDRELITNPTYVALLSLDGGKSAGSGFFLNINHVDYLITARHVLLDEYDHRASEILLSTQHPKSHRMEDSAMIQIDMKKARIIDKNVDDVVAVQIGVIKESQFKDYVTIINEGSFKPVSIGHDATLMIDNLGLANETFLIGFPTSLIFQQYKHFDPGKPLITKGIIAGINSESNTFIIDCSAYYGNSGGPVLELGQDNQLKVAGIVSKYIPFVTEWRNNREPLVTHIEYSNSGYSVCVPMNAIFNLFN